MRPFCAQDKPCLGVTARPEEKTATNIIVHTVNTNYIQTQLSRHEKEEKEQMTLIKHYSSHGSTTAGQGDVVEW